MFRVFRFITSIYSSYDLGSELVNLISYRCYLISGCWRLINPFFYLTHIAWLWWSFLFIFIFFKILIEQLWVCTFVGEYVLTYTHPILSVKTLMFRTELIYICGRCYLTRGIFFWDPFLCFGDDFNSSIVFISTVVLI